MKKFLSFLLVCTFCFTLSSTAFAATKDSSETVTSSDGKPIYFSATKNSSKTDTTSSSGDYEFSIKANAVQIAKINSIKGKKMTRLEFYEEVFPDVAKHFTAHQKEFFSKMEYSQPGTSSTLNTSNVTRSSIVGTAASIIHQNSNRSIKFETLVGTSENADSITIDSYLRDSDRNYIDYASAYETDAKSAEADGTFDNPDKGTSYRTEGEVYVYKSNVTPSSMITYPNSKWLKAR